MADNLNKLKNFWRGKKVFLTGHTGFKGSWLCLFLNMLGAKVIGYSLRPVKKPNLYSLANLNKKIYSSIIGDIRDYDKLKKNIHKHAPDFIIHMAAQPLVLDSYINPKYTYEVNIMGTVNILSILKDTSSVKATLITTTDKVYFNNNKKKYFKESDILGGIDPYSNSKSCVEFVVNSYIQSFFKKKNYIVTARAGNVIGG